MSEDETPARPTPAAPRVVTVFGGTGFLGRRIVARLVERGIRVRVASRHPGRTHPNPTGRGEIEPVEADIRDGASVAAALRGADGAVNAVSLYVETGGTTFRTIHVEAARRLAAEAVNTGLAALVHLSGIGADAGSGDAYIRSRAEGEAAVRDAFPHATIFRPSAMFGPDDALLNTLIRMVRMSPIVPLFGQGGTRLQTVFVGDVAEAAANALADPSARGRTFELGGPEMFTYRQLVELVAERVGKRRIMLPVPFAVWRMMAVAARILPSPPLTPAQVALMERDNVAAADRPGLRDLGVEPTPVGRVLARDLGLG